MKFDSPLFDHIRVKPGEDRRTRAPDAPCCEWKGCGNTATHRAPKGRERENEHWRFCLEHVREYNHSYNFFAGMSTDAVSKYQKDSITGHRPTWKMGTGNRAGRRRPRPKRAGSVQPVPRVRQRRQLAAEIRARRADAHVRNAERKALHALGLELDVSAVEIKARFKELVKRHHPDANGGDRVYEDKLREIIQAYNYLKSVKLC